MVSNPTLVTSGRGKLTCTKVSEGRWEDNTVSPSLQPAYIDWISHNFVATPDDGAELERFEVEVVDSSRSGSSTYVISYGPNQSSWQSPDINNSGSSFFNHTTVLSGATTSSTTSFIVRAYFTSGSPGGGDIPDDPIPPATKKYVLSVVASPSELGNVSIVPLNKTTELFADGSNAYIQATPNDGCKFLYWIDESGTKIREESYGLTVSKDKSFIAYFSRPSGLLIWG